MNLYRKQLRNKRSYDIMNLFVRLFEKKIFHSNEESIKVAAEATISELQIAKEAVISQNKLSWKQFYATAVGD